MNSEDQLQDIEKHDVHVQALISIDKKKQEKDIDKKKQEKKSYIF